MLGGRTAGSIELIRYKFMTRRFIEERFDTCGGKSVADACSAADVADAEV